MLADWAAGTIIRVGVSLDVSHKKDSWMWHVKSWAMVAVASHKHHTQQKLSILRAQAIQNYFNFSFDDVMAMSFSREDIELVSNIKVTCFDIIKEQFNLYNLYIKGKG